jgi:hypothetical protein
VDHKTEAKAFIQVVPTPPLDFAAPTFGDTKIIKLNTPWSGFKMLVKYDNTIGQFAPIASTATPMYKNDHVKK